MAVARLIVEAVHTTGDGYSLRYHRGIPYQWNGTYWAETALRDLRSATYHFLEHAQYIDKKSERVPWAPTKRKLDDVIDALGAITLIDSQVEAPIWLDGVERLPATEIVSMRNGLLHVPSRTLLPHTCQLFIRHSLPFEFLADPPFPERWLSFLSSLWPDDDSSIEALQEIMGYLLSGGTSLQKMFLLVGPRRGGKGTIGRVLSGLMGTQNVAAPTLAGLATNFGLSALIGKPLAMIADARLSARSELSVVVERLLSISGEDTLTIDRKFRDPWTGRLPTRFLIMSNELPRFNDAANAIVSRFLVLVLTRSFDGIEDPRLTDKLLTEAPSIFSWALAGLDRLVCRGHFNQPRSGREALEAMEDLASPINAFLRMRCIVEPFARVSSDSLWETWKSWCASENCPPGSKTVFGRDLRAALPNIEKRRPRSSDTRSYEYVGIGLADMTHNDDQPRPLGPDGSLEAPGPHGPRSKPMHSEHNEGASRFDGRRFDGRF
jgi:putative DNA primase/helicase